MHLFGAEMERDDDGYLFPVDMPAWQRQLARQLMDNTGAQMVAMNLPRRWGLGEIERLVNHTMLSQT